MFKVTYYTGGNYQVNNKLFENYSEATKFAVTLPVDAVLEIKYYENCTDNGPTLRS